MDQVYPTPQDAGIRIPPNLQQDRFCAGFRHGLGGGQLQAARHRLQMRAGGQRPCRIGTGGDGEASKVMIGR